MKIILVFTVSQELYNVSCNLNHHFHHSNKYQTENNYLETTLPFPIMEIMAQKIVLTFDFLIVVKIMFRSKSRYLCQKELKFAHLFINFPMNKY